MHNDTIYWLNGQSLDGLGSTKFILELSKNKNYKIINYSYDNIKFVNSRNFKTNSIYTNNFLNDFNNTQIIIINSLPSNKYTLEQIDWFYQMLYELKKRGKILLLFLHFNTVAYLNKIPKIFNAINVVNNIYVFNCDGTYASIIKEYLNYKKDNLSSFSLPYTFNDNSITKKEKKITYIGRYATFKNPQYMLNLYEYLKDYLKFELHGLGKTIEMKQNLLDKYNLKFKDYNSDILITGPTKNEVIINYLKNSMFAFSGFTLKNKNDYGNRIEYAMYEMIDNNCICIFTKHCLENAGFNYRKFLTIENDNFEELSKKIIYLINNESARNEIIYAQKEEAMKHCNQSVIFDKIYNQINYLNNYKSINDLKRHLLKEKYDKANDICYDLSDLKLSKNRIYYYDKKLRKKEKDDTSQYEFKF